MGKDELVKLIEECDYDERDKIFDLCSQLKAVAEADEDNNMVGVALYYEADALYDIDEERAYQIMLQSVNYLSKKDNALMWAKANNTLGILASHKEDYTTAINYHIVCLDECTKHDYKYVAALTSANLGFLFQSICMYDKAVEYFEGAVDYFNKVEDNPNIELHLATILTNLFTCRYFLEDKAALDKIIVELRGKKELVSPSFANDFLEAVYASVYDDDATMRAYIKNAIDLVSQEDNVEDYLDMYQFLARFLHEKKLFDELETAFKLIDKYLPKEVFPRIQIELTKYKMSLYKYKNDIQKYMECAERYTELYETITNTYYKTISESLDLQLYIKRLMDQEKFYQKEAGTDNLTQLLNRNGLEKYATSVIYEAMAQGDPVTTIILDVDYFKQYNDYYGHVLGDECLKKVAQVLLNSITRDVCACRFGGDEFVVICGNMDKEQATAYVSNIIDKVHKLAIESEKSPISDYVTVSIGVNVGVPAMGSSLMDLINLADKALYQVKEEGRNNFKIQ